MNRSSLVFLALPLVLAAPQAALAQDPAAPACGEMHLTQSIEEIQFIDAGAEGVDPGDRRILRWAVGTPEGERIGTFYVVTTVLEVRDSGDVARADGHVVFANGDLRVSVISTLSDAANTERSNAAPIEWSIDGGTGDFAGASGTLVNGPAGDDDDLEHWILDISASCP